MNIYLHYSDDEEIELFKFPVVPKEIKIKYFNNTGESYNSLGHGEMFFYKKEKTLKSISFSSFFPSQNYRFLKSSNFLSWDCLEKLINIRKSGKPIIVTITNLKEMKKSFRMECLIKEFEVEKHETTTGRTFFSIEFAEYKKLSAL
ncbi:MAG: hypothetical protein ACRCZ0_09090 [Cetobacterium sp.]